MTRPIQTQADQHPQRMAGLKIGADWKSGLHGSWSNDDQGHQLGVRYPWGEDNGNGSHSGNPYHEWRHTGPDGETLGKGVADSHEGAMAQAEGNHRSFTTDVDHVMDPFDPRLIGARRRLSWYIDADMMGETPDDNPGQGDKDKDVAAAGMAGAAGASDSIGVAPGAGAMPAGSASMPMDTSITRHVQDSGPGGGGSGSGMPGSSGGGMPGSGGSGTHVDYTPGSGVSQWKTQVETGLQRNGLPTSLENQVMHQMQTESGGDPNAINRTDSNAQAGHPSQGLLQTIPGTFNQYHLPGDSANIDDPQANIDSAIGYAKSRYGPTLLNQQGHGMGSGTGY